MATQPPVDIAPPTYNASGIALRSNFNQGLIASSFEGPWYIEEQTMTIDYQRVPIGALSSTTVTVSSAEAGFRLYGSYLVAEVNATYNAYKDYNTYTTSAWTQPQKFQFIQSNTDSYGTSYGALNASCLGVMGSIVTTQNYYHRVPWDDASGNHVENIRNMNAANYWAINRAYGVSSTVDPRPMKDDYEQWLIDYAMAGSFTSDWDPVMQSRRDYVIPGSYSTSGETLWKIFNLIDDFGTRVKTSEHTKLPATYDTTIAPNLQGGIVGVIHDQGFIEYEINRHDYS